MLEGGMTKVVLMSIQTCSLRIRILFYDQIKFQKYQF
jgi:hypothetical protein